jgi:hypothetical protein
MKLKYTDILTREYFQKEYIDNKKSILTISKELGITPNVINSRLNSFKLKRTKSESCTGEHNAQWKGNSVKYEALHGWIKWHKPKSLFCEKCGELTQKLDIANISGEYKRDIMDFRWLCRRCHMTEDGRLTNLKKWSYKKNGE